MSAVAKHKPPTVLESSVRLFGEISEIFSRPNSVPSAKVVSGSINKSLRQLKKHGSHDEVVALREVVRELASQVDRLLPAEGARVLPAMTDLGELARAQQEDELAEKVLGASRRRGPATLSTPESVRLGDEAIARAEQNARATIAARIANKELISSGELQLGMGVKRQALSNAVKAERLFAIVGPSGDNYYPAYYADPTLDRRTLEQVSKALGSLPAASKHHFFTSESTLLKETPLDALRRGRKAEVLVAAAGFAER